MLFLSKKKRIFLICTNFRNSKFAWSLKFRKVMSFVPNRQWPGGSPKEILSMIWTQKVWFKNVKQLASFWQRVRRQEEKDCFSFLQTNLKAIYSGKWHADRLGCKKKLSSFELWRNAYLYSPDWNAKLDTLRIARDEVTQPGEFWPQTLPFNTFRESPSLDAFIGWCNRRVQPHCPSPAGQTGRRA